MKRMRRCMLCAMILVGLVVGSAIPVSACHNVVTKTSSSKVVKSVKLPNKKAIDKRANKQSKKLRRVIAKGGWKLAKVRYSKKHTRVYTYELAEDQLTIRMRVVQKIGKKTSKFKIADRYISQKRAISDYKKGRYLVIAFFDCPPKQDVPPLPLDNKVFD